MVISTLVSGIGESVLESVCTKGIENLWINKNQLSLYCKTLFGKHKNAQVRFSISYLFRIKIPKTNSYLLVLNRRISNQLQPVGGAYKRYGDDKLFESWGYQPDKKSNGLGLDSVSENDLRFFVKGRYVINVIKWFETGRERECNANREFIEELIETRILDKNLFDKIQYKQIKREATHLKWSEFHKCFEILIYDIFELMPSTEQKDFLIKLAAEDFDLTKGYAIVECEEIEQQRLVKGGVQVAKIGQHSKLIINDK